ncbi:hypothetical protein Lepil_1939 [Leptonema illini DSM 21528]|jgi:hypothetical protein|uniref:Uncharacterized protein n=2 Tax=Leptonema illini TaxID=183 RepID=H2CEL0_9LEPT|nr:hypothetical protein Lepil_1939 [Leptonema illini DSM 21528]
MSGFFFYEPLEDYSIFMNKFILLLSSCVLFFNAIGCKNPPSEAKPRSHFESPSGHYRFSIIQSTEYEKCTRQMPMIGLFMSVDPNSGPFACGYTISDLQSGKPVFAYSWVDGLTAQTLPGPAPNCDVNNAEVVLGFKRWTEKDEIVFTVFSLWYGAADPGYRSYVYDWRNCKKVFLSGIYTPHCPGTCNSLLEYHYLNKSYLFHKDIKTDMVTIYRTRATARHIHDYYKEEFEESDPEDLKPDPEKTIIIGSFYSQDYPSVEESDDGRLFITADKKHLILDPSTDRLDFNG